MTAWPDPARAVTAWNQHHEVGVQVEYRSRKDAEPAGTVTTAQAEVLQGHTAVVWLEGVSGCVSIGHCTPV